MILVHRNTKTICPAYAGMILEAAPRAMRAMNLSRVCGDDPQDGGAGDAFMAFVPRMRG